MITLEQARERILQVIAPATSEAVPLPQARGRFCAQAITAPIDLPPFDNSAMDGYAVQAADLRSASDTQPVVLQLLDRVAAGDVPHSPIMPGTCARVFTGSPIPPGADAVIMQEETRHEPRDPDRLIALGQVKPWENIRMRGEDVRAGTAIVNAGERLTSGLIGILAAMGMAQVEVGRQPKVALLATGSELAEAGGLLAPGKIYESNRVVLSVLTEAAGARPHSYPLVPDTMEQTCAALDRALQECDLIVTSGGVSVGELDLVKDAFSSLGGQLDFWRVAIKPGKPFVFGQRKEKCLFGLPGNPVSAAITFLLLVRPAILRWQGAADLELPQQTATLVEPLQSGGDRRHFVRVSVNAKGEVRSSGTQASHMLHSLAHSNGLVDVPANTTLEAGTTVSVLRWDL